MIHAHRLEGFFTDEKRSAVWMVHDHPSPDLEHAHGPIAVGYPSTSQGRYVEDLVVQGVEIE